MSIPGSVRYSDSIGAKERAAYREHAPLGAAAIGRVGASSVGDAHTRPTTQRSQAPLGPSHKWHSQRTAFFSPKKLLIFKLF